MENNNIYLYKNQFMRIFEEFAEQTNPQTGKRLRSEKSIDSAYRHRIIEFIEVELSTPKNYQIEIKDINCDHVNEFLNKIPSDAINFYRTLMPFFRFMYKHKYTRDITTFVEVPEIKSIGFPFIIQEHCRKIVEYINNRNNRFDERLLLALFYYTGLGLKYIYDLDHSCFDKDYSIMWLKYKDKPRHVPVKKELQQLLIENRRALERTMEVVNPNIKILDFERSTDISGKMSRLTKKITGQKYPPRCFEKTFIKRALSVNMNPYFISQLTLASIDTVAQYINDDISFQQQKEILDQIDTVI